MAYCNAVPNRSGGCTHNCARIPSVNSIEDFVSPLPSTRAISFCDVNTFITASDSLQATSRSRSPTVDFIRRKLPAASAATTPLIPRNMVKMLRAIGKATPNGVLPLRRESDSIPSKIFCSDFAPMPSKLRSSPACAAAFNCSSVVIPFIFQNIAAFFGPKLGTLITSNSVTGISRLSFSKNSSLPVLSSSSIFSAIASPTPGISRNLPSRHTSFTSRPYSARVSAALR